MDQSKDLHSSKPVVVLVRPTEQGNVGAAARAMANMGLHELILVEPAVEIGGTARAFAVGAGFVLDNARRVPSLAEALAPFRRAVGTTSNRERVTAAPLITARQLPAALATDPPGTPTALVFGPERSGLTTDELATLSPLVRIPSSAAQPTLNLAQAVLVVAYELAEDARPGPVPGAAPHDLPATAAEIDGLFGHFDQAAEAVGFARDDTAAAARRDLRRFIGRAAPTSREVTLLRGFLRRVLRAGTPNRPETR
jgi:TrmH family RNA methyltransferase